MAEQPVNLSTVLYLGVFSRAEQRVLQAVLKAIAEGNGKCVATAGIVAAQAQSDHRYRLVYCRVTLGTKIAITAEMGFARGR